MKMLKHMKRAILGVVLVGVVGCPLPDVPFDASGRYETDLEVIVIGVVQQFEPCILNMDLDQNPNAIRPIRSNIRGTIDVDLTCITEVSNPLLISVPEMLSFNVTGRVGNSGQLVLSGTSCDLARCSAIEFNGQGADTTGNGRLDQLAGSFTVSTLLANFNAIIIAGTFDISDDLIPSPH